MIFRRRDESSIEVQLAPMADIGFFVDLLFPYLIAAARLEADLGMTLPGSVSDEVSMEIPEEVRIGIRPDGGVEVNEAIVGPA